MYAPDETGDVLFLPAGTYLLNTSAVLTSWNFKVTYIQGREGGWYPDVELIYGNKAKGLYE